MVLLLMVFGGYGQGVRESPKLSWQEKFFQHSEQVLPLLIQQALKASPEMENNAAQRQIAFENIKITKKSIISGFSVGGGYVYGTRIGFGDFNQGGLNPFGQPAQGMYNVGFNVGLPLGQLVSRHNEIRIQELNLQQTEALGKLQERETRATVIQLYQDIVMAKAELELRQEALQSANIHLRMAEKQLASRVIQITEMARINEMYSAAAIGHGTAKVRYETSFLMMEELIGMRISDIMAILDK